nr:hypothetical protein TetV2_00533 [Oceanusvirus sp.]
MLFIDTFSYKLSDVEKRDMVRTAKEAVIAAEQVIQEANEYRDRFEKLKKDTITLRDYGSPSATNPTVTLGTAGARNVIEAYGCVKGWPEQAKTIPQYDPTTAKGLLSEADYLHRGKEEGYFTQDDFKTFLQKNCENKWLENRSDIIAEFAINDNNQVDALRGLAEKALEYSRLEKLFSEYPDDRNTKMFDIPEIKQYIARHQRGEEYLDVFREMKDSTEKIREWTAAASEILESYKLGPGPEKSGGGRRVGLNTFSIVSGVVVAMASAILQG